MPGLPFLHRPEGALDFNVLRKTNGPFPPKCVG